MCVRISLKNMSIKDMIFDCKKMIQTRDDINNTEPSSSEFSDDDEELIDNLNFYWVDIPVRIKNLIIQFLRHTVFIENFLP